jgi:DNA (cytosine-5)-methyltransferase 1
LRIMKFLSVCSGIEAASVAWKPLGWESVGFSEIEKFPCAVLNHHYPTVPNYGDITKYKEWPDANFDVLCGGTPCQSFSVAGLRKGMDDPRGNLALVFLGIADRYRPRWVVWENVPGVLSSNGGKDFGSFLGGLGVLGYGFAYRVLDAQYFGLAQRRKRVFVVGCFGDWRSAASVLFERESLSGNPAPSRKKRKGFTHDIAKGTTTSRFQRIGYPTGQDNLVAIPEIAGCLNSVGGHAVPGNSIQDADQGYLIAQEFYDNHPTDSRITGPHKIANSVTSRYGTGGGNVPLVAHSLKSRHDVSEDGTGRGTPIIPEVAVAVDTYNYTTNERTTQTLGSSASDVNHIGAVVQNMAIRKLTPTECERLMGFPDNYTAVTHRGKPAADGPRYKALGNSWAVPVVRWIGRRLQSVENL